jgi:hypothetical protein
MPRHYHGFSARFMPANRSCRAWRLTLRSASRLGNELQRSRHQRCGPCTPTVPPCLRSPRHHLAENSRKLTTKDRTWRGGLTTSVSHSFAVCEGPDMTDRLKLYLLMALCARETARRCRRLKRKYPEPKHSYIWSVKRGRPIAKPHSGLTAPVSHAAKRRVGRRAERDVRQRSCAQAPTPTARRQAGRSQ